MKKNIILISFLLLIFNSCTKDKSVNSGKISPPSWIIGTWEHRVSKSSWVFKNDDIIQNFGGASNSQKESISIFEKSGQSIKVEEDILEDRYYRIRINYPSTALVLEFERRSTNEIVELSLNPLGNTVIYKKQ